MTGYTILGAAPDRVITIRVRNALALAKRQSALASAAALVPGAGPDFVEGQAYQAVAQKINEALAAQKADAEVRVIDGVGIVPRPKIFYTAPAHPVVDADVEETPAWKYTKTYGWGVATGFGLSGLVALVWHYFIRDHAPSVV